MNGSIGAGMAQRSAVGSGRTSAASPNMTGGGAQQGNSVAESSEFMRVVGEMTIQQAMLVGNGIISNMQPDDAGDG